MSTPEWPREQVREHMSALLPELNYRKSDGE